MTEKTKVIGKVILPTGYYVNVDESIKYNYSLISMNDQIKTPIQNFIDKRYNDLDIKAPDRLTNYKKTALNNILINLLVASDEGKLVAVPRGRDYYKGYTFYNINHYTYSYIVNGVDALRKAGYVKQWNGYYDRVYGKGKVSRIWALEKLLGEIESYSADFIKKIKTDVKNNGAVGLLKYYTQRIKYTNPIILKDKKKRLAGYKQTKKTLEMRGFLEFYNTFINENKITWPFPYLCPSYTNNSFNPVQHIYTEPTTTQSINSAFLPLLGKDEAKLSNGIELYCQLYRVFNNESFSQGGRFYGADYQGLSGEERAKILINGNETIEIDYSALHPRMIYQLNKIDYQGDPYADVCDIPELRKAIKILMQMIINAANICEAIHAFRNEINEADNKEIKLAMVKNKISDYELLNLIIDKHFKIKNYFNSKIGIKLQYIDSRIAEEILRYFTMQQKVCLCIHDSFIVERKYEDELEYVMKEKYKNEIGFEPKVKKNK